MGGATWRVIEGRCEAVLPTLEAGSVHCCVTSPPYFGLRDYGSPGQIGLEKTPAEYVARLVGVFREVRRVLRDDGTLWLNLGDSYNAYNGNRGRSTSFQSATENALPVLPTGHGLTVKALKPKDLIGIPWMVAFALRDDGWYLRSDIIWHKPSPMPESVRDRPTKAHEYLFLLSKSARYHYDAEAIAEAAEHDGRSVEFGKKDAAARLVARLSGNMVPGVKYITGGTRNKRSVWTVAPVPYHGAHFAVMPEALVEPCVLAGCPAGGVILDPFVGSGTVLAVALRNDRNAVGIDLNPDYLDLARERCGGVVGPLFAAPPAPAPAAPSLFPAEGG